MEKTWKDKLKEFTQNAADYIKNKASKKSNAWRTTAYVTENYEYDFELGGATITYNNYIITNKGIVNIIDTDTLIDHDREETCQILSEGDLIEFDEIPDKFDVSDIIELADRI